MLVALRIVRGVRALAAAAAVRADDQRVAAPDREREHDRARQDDPEQLGPGVPLDRRAVEDGLALVPKVDERIDERDDDEQPHWHEQRGQDDVGVTLGAALGAHPPRRQVRPEHEHDQRYRYRREHEPDRHDQEPVPRRALAGDRRHFTIR